MGLAIIGTRGIMGKALSAFFRPPFPCCPGDSVSGPPIQIEEEMDLKVSACVLSTAMLMGLAFHVISDQVVVAEEKDPRPVAHPMPVHGGLRGIVSPVDGDAVWQLTDLDRARMRRGVEAYVTEFGPLSRSDDHSGFTGDSPPLLSFYPFGGRVGEDFNLHHFFAHTSPSGDIQDWNCGGYTLDGIIATMGLVPTFDRQLIGIPVYAALDGVVVTTHDGEDDQNVDYEDERPTNFVRLDHGQGLQTSSFHLRKDSILVSPGDEVRAGQQIGEAGASGN
ncbi:MAG: M23 family metallopeptidase, partial [Phycisphaera sp.]|nr:M23 family metallopeptidase [Phycisphaera sp.]